MDRTPGPATPSRSLRRSSTAPISSPAASASAAASPSSAAGTPANSEADAVETLYAHPAAKVIAFSASSSSTTWYTPRSPSPETGLSMEDEPGSLPWSSRLERTLAVGPLRIYKAPRSVAFLSCGSALQPILPKSKCWCIDEESSKFVLQIRRPQYWRIELPISGPDEVELALAFRDVLDDILLFEKTPCPFKRTFEVVIPEMPEITYIPWAPRIREQLPEEPAEEAKAASPPKTPGDDSAWLPGPPGERTEYRYTMPDWESRIGEPTPPETPRGSKDGGKQAPMEAGKADTASSCKPGTAGVAPINGNHGPGKAPVPLPSNGPDTECGTSPCPPASAPNRPQNGRLESVLAQSSHQADPDKPVVHHRATASTISVRRPTLSTLPPAANLFSPPNLWLRQDPSRLRLSRAREVPAVIIKKTMELLLGPPTYLIKLMLKVAARIAAGQWRGLVFGFDDSGERIPVQWDYSDGDLSDDDDNYYYMAPADDVDEDPSQGWGVD